MTTNMGGIDRGLRIIVGLALLWYALLAPAGTPAPLVARLNADLNRVISEPVTARALIERGFFPAPGTPDALAAVIRGDLARWKTVTDAIDIKMD